MKNLVKVAVVAAGMFLAGAKAEAQQKLGHINSADLLQSMPEMKAADATFQTFQKQKQSVLEQMDAERQKKITTYQEKYKTISEANKETVGKELTTLQTEIQDLEKRLGDAQQKAQEELKTKQAELYQPVFKKAEDAVKAVSKEKGYAYVFDVSQPGVVYFDGGDDIINSVKAKLGISTTASTAPKK
ncbi:OmpH family outer membrane protein [Pedobacter sp. HMF7647]|uniref:OmpH family outer membrane protein n=1 Tax=Hufsiella arboris TaxID=2695275 RepID=A0A7K1YA20_9SPHI|nr:OmpH family outer membrane protein [Hufsiella arboris]MXV51414.1 OmpH family outer membrane protein [Hufsiella arboris]